MWKWRPFSFRAFFFFFFFPEAAAVEQPQEVQKVRKSVAETLTAFPGPFTFPAPVWLSFMVQCHFPQIYPFPLV